MLLAGNGVSMAPNAVQPKVQPQTPNAKTTATNGVTHGSGLPSPISVSSHTGAQSGSGSTSTEEVKTTAVATTPVYRLEPPKTATNVMVPVATTSSTPEGTYSIQKSSNCISIYHLHTKASCCHS